LALFLIIKKYLTLWLKLSKDTDNQHPWRHQTPQLTEVFDVAIKDHKTLIELSQSKEKLSSK